MPNPADAPVQKSDENNPPRRSERLWSEEVGIARASEPVLPEPGYEFTGHTFNDGKGPYA